MGGGIGGLTAASLLARAGCGVLLLEASSRLGGACLGLMQDGHRYDLGASLLTGTGPGGPVAVLCDRLAISLPTIPCDPAVQVALPRHRLGLSRSVDGWWSEIHREFPEDEAGWHDLVTDLTALARDRDDLAQHLPPLPPGGWRERLDCWRVLTWRSLTGAAREATRRLRKAAEKPLPETLAEYGLGVASRQALEACLWYLLLRGTDECSTLEAALALQRLRDGVAILPHGLSTLTDLLAQRLQADGGEIRLDTGAARCIAERGRIVGVTTRAGETIRARWVVTGVPPGVLMSGLLPKSSGGLGRYLPGRGSWRPRCIVQIMGVAVPEVVVPSELGWHCFTVADAGRPARDENLVFIRRVSDGLEPGDGHGIAHFSVGRFVPPSAPQEEQVVVPALLQALDQVIPGVADALVHQRLMPPAALEELWGRPMAAVRYEVDAREWLGRRGLAHHLGWTGLLAVGEWTYPGRLVSDVVEGAMHVADHISTAK